MSNLAGIIYPNALFMTNLVKEMSRVYSHTPHFFRHQNLELCGWNKEPHSNEEKTVWILFDGKILNFAKLQSECKTQATSDEQLLLDAYEKWGAEFISHLDGPFALCLFDTKAEVLLLACDPLGQKSLYWSDQGDYFLFSTEIKGLLASGLVAQNPSPSTMATFLHFGYVPQDLCLIQGVNKLLPTFFLQINLKRQWMIKQYFSLSEQMLKPQQISLESAKEKFASSLVSATQKTLLPKEKVCTLTCPDLGSLSLSWFIQQNSAANRTKTISSSSKEIDPSAVLDALVSIVWQLDEPVSDPNVIHTWELSRLAQGFGSYAISSIGWQQLLAGDPRFFTYGSSRNLHLSIPHKLALLPPLIRDHFLLPLLHAIHSPLRYEVLRSVDMNQNLMAYLLDSALFRGKNRKKVSPFLDRYFNLEVFTQHFHRLADFQSKIKQSLYLEMKTHLPDCLLHQYNKLFSARGITPLFPFLDNDLLVFISSLPDEVSFREPIPGYLLQSLMEKLAPSFAPPANPEALCFASWGETKRMQAIFLSLENGRLVEEGWIAKKWIRAQLKGKKMSEQLFSQLWSLLILEIWFRLYINRPIGMQATDVPLEEFLEIKPESDS